VLHPQIGDGFYRKKVKRLASALAHENEEGRGAAGSALRGFITANRATAR
jgi:hypothetical protein